MRTSGIEYEPRLEEKKELAPFPSKFSDTLLSEIGDYFEDAFPYRKAIVSELKINLQKISSPYRAGFFKILSEKLYPSRKSADGSYFLAPLQEGEVLYGKNGWLFFAGENNIDHYLNKTPFSAEDLYNAGEAASELGSICNAKDIRLAFIIPPSKEQIYSEYMPGLIPASGASRAEVLENYIVKNYDLNIIYPKHELENFKNICDLYYTQDSHWNRAGALIGIRCIYDILGIPFSDVDISRICQEDMIGGDLSNFCGYMTRYLDYYFDYKPEIKPEVTESAAGPFVFEAYNKDAEGRLVLIGDSFRTNMENYLAKDFKYVTVSHFMAANSDEIICALRSLKKGDVLIIESTERYDDLFAERCRLVSGLIS